jgi:hypothetical protein
MVALQAALQPSSSASSPAPMISSAISRQDCSIHACSGFNTHTRTSSRDVSAESRRFALFKETDQFVFLDAHPPLLSQEGLTFCELYRLSNHLVHRVAGLNRDKQTLIFISSFTRRVWFSIRFGPPSQMQSRLREEKRPEVFKRIRAEPWKTWRLSLVACGQMDSGTCCMNTRPSNKPMLPT